jgi:hypothetical protein
VVKKQGNIEKANSEKKELMGNYRTSLEFQRAKQRKQNKTEQKNREREREREENL